MLFRRSVAFLLPTVLYYFVSLYPLMADAFLRHFSHRREKRFRGGGRGLKTSHNCVFSLIMLLSKSIQKVYQFKSVLLWIVYTCQLDIFQSTFWQNSTIWKPGQSIFFQLRFFRLRMKEIKAIPFPPRGIRAIRTSFARLCITTNALFPSTSSLSLFSPSSETRETRQKWPHTWMKARDGRGTEKRD